ncbi:hypothetical protein, partial [Pseudomaricurvus sp.]|uniref:hypothetical protein n=1 Tax=Pseudomaricurvus sp. TaxID=2004510 RepID=UPI003F6CFBDB
KALAKHTFSVSSPHASLAQLRQLIERCGGNVSDQWITALDPNSPSLTHQQADAANIVNQLGAKPSSLSALEVHKQRQVILNSPSS